MVAGGGAGRTAKVVLTPAFKLVFISVFALTLIALGVSVGLSVAIAKPTANVNNLIDTTETVYKIGFGAIAGLLGGKVG